MGTRGKSKYNGKFKAGHSFGHWTVVDGQTVGSPAKLHVVCECGTDKYVDAYTLVKGKTTSCGCVRVGEQAPNWQGINGVSKTTITRNMNRVRECTVNSIQAANVYVSQSGTCALTGQALSPTTARLERIDSNKPYEANNVLWVHNSVSPMTATYGVQGTVTAANSIVSNTSQLNNIFEKLGFEPAKGETK